MDNPQLPSFPPPPAAPTPVAPLSFPPPPPPPAAPGPQRHSSMAASIRSWESMEPSIDDLNHEIAQVKEELTTINDSVEEIELLRDQVVESPLPASQLLHPLKQLQSSVASTGTRILSISSPLTAVSARVASLADLAAEGRAAATALEIAQAEEELEVVKLGIKDTVERIKALAFEEVKGREEARVRWEAKLRNENPSMGEDLVQGSVRQAMEGLNKKVAQLDVISYAGRFAAENPFTELAHLVDTAQNVHRSNTVSSVGSESSMPFSKLLSRAGSQTTLVGSMHTVDKYGKLESEADLESQPLQGLARGSGLGAGSSGSQEHVGPLMKKWVYFRKNWRDVLVRTGVVVAVVATVVSIIVYESLHQGDKDDDSASSSAAAVAGATAR
ncbi:hypothetical protein BCR35DRAFT_333912 [Leucosporidium creatinivorum]|uniref:Uncharacterized protein n=1 Tax=Leucosporidium creatinivorum TaxID=106004 RepID=A0A1Y2EPF4_9BASI|nr:hypothetical protein BCR35DRAFT_333912 [Leucosporidium creatinivorum]